MANELLRGLPRYFDNDQLARLAAARVGIAGAGGLGSNAALMLARSGVGGFTLVDCDVVEASNLNRQQYWPRDIGRPKVDALRDRLLELNPELEIESRQIRLDARNTPEILQKCPLWVEAFDDPQAKAMLVELVMLSGRKCASASGMGGYGGPPMTRRKLGNLILVGDFSSDILRHPPLAPRVTQAAALLADAILEFILDS